MTITLTLNVEEATTVILGLQCRRQRLQRRQEVLADDSFTLQQHIQTELQVIKSIERRM